MTLAAAVGAIAAGAPAARPRVLHLVPALFGPAGVYGGAERYALELSLAMAARVPARLAGFGPAAVERVGALTIYRVPPRLRSGRFADNPAGFGLLPHLQWADVIHCHQTHTMATSLALLYARLRRKPIFGTDHGGGGLSLYRLGDVSGWFSGRLFVSRFSQGAPEPGRAPAVRDAVILGGVDAHRFLPDPAAPPRAGALFVGRLLPHKGVGDLIRAAQIAAVPLTVLGRALDSAYFAQLRNLAAGQPVEFLAAGGDAELIRHYQRAICVALPSVYRDERGGLSPAPELLGQTLLEAMACATPVVATRVGGLPEVVLDGVTGFLVPPNDPAALAAKLAWLRDHPDAARRMGEAARRHMIERFSWEGVVDRCLQAYRGALPAAPERGA